MQKLVTMSTFLNAQYQVWTFGLLGSPITIELTISVVIYTSWKCRETFLYGSPSTSKQFQDNSFPINIE